MRDLLRNGIIIGIGSGVVSLQGFLITSVGEVFSVGQVNGIVVNIGRDEYMNLVIGALLLNPGCRICEGAKVVGLSRLATFLIGGYCVGSMLDPLGSVIFNSRTVGLEYRWVIESPSPGIISRQSVYEPLQTGILAIDSMIPVGRGQRELIVGDRQTGKTSIGVDTILNQRSSLGASSSLGSSSLGSSSNSSSNVMCVYVPIGQKASSILEIFIALAKRDALFYVSVLVASASSSAVYQYLCAYSGAALAEFFVFVGHKPAFLMLDDLTRHAYAYREIYLLLRRPPGREAYPGEIFFVHSRLLERAAKLSVALGGGSITAFPVIETLAQDVSGYITTNVISITDGQIFLSIDLFLSGIKPSIDVGLSVSRVGSAAQVTSMKLVAGTYKLELAQYIELQAFSQFSNSRCRRRNKNKIRKRS